MNDARASSTASHAINDRNSDRKLGRHLLLLVMIKIVILYGLWAVFIKPNKVKVDVSDVTRMYQGQSTPPSDVQFNQKIKE